MIKGIDISKHQGLVNFERVKAAGFEFCYVKATEGTGYVDPRFVSNVCAARKAGLRVGAYHFARPDSLGAAGPQADAEAEARTFCDAMAEAGMIGERMLPPALDFEKYSDNDVKQNVPWIRTFLQWVQLHARRQPAIYTGRNIWKYEVGNSDEFTGYPLWLVRYQGEGKPQLGAMPWGKWTFWQWSGGGKFAYHGPVAGVDGDCDVNYFNGSLVELQALCGFEREARPVQDSGHKEALAKVRAMLAFHQYEAARLGKTVADLEKTVADLEAAAGQGV